MQSTSRKLYVFEDVPASQVDALVKEKGITQMTLSEIIAHRYREEIRRKYTYLPLEERPMPGLHQIIDPETGTYDKSPMVCHYILPREKFRLLSVDRYEPSELLGVWVDEGELEVTGIRQLSAVWKDVLMQVVGFKTSSVTQQPAKELHAKKEEPLEDAQRDGQKIRLKFLVRQ